MAKTGINIVPRPNPEKKVRREASNATILIMVISIVKMSWITNKLFNGSCGFANKEDSN